MIIDYNHFLRNNIPRFDCPTCATGQLKLIEKTFQEVHPAWINNLPNFDEDISYRANASKI